MYAPPAREFLYLAYKLEIHFSDAGGTIRSGNGTAFLLASSNVPILVTNRHVVDLDYLASDQRYKDFRIVKLVLHGRSSNDSRYEIELDCSKEFIFPSARENDVACLIDFTGRSPHPEFKLYHHVGVDELAAEKDFNTSIWPGDLVFFSGFPSATHDKLDQRPILRAGIIASDPRYNYSVSGKYEGERIAYEAMSTSGSSGSPVYAPNRGIVGFHDYERRGFIVGINVGHIPAEYGRHSGISYFIKSTVIRDLLTSAGVPFK